MTWENIVEEKDEWTDEEEIKCPFCNKPFMHHIMESYTGYHSRETMIHCDACDNIWVVVYNFSHIVKLKKEIVV